MTCQSTQTCLFQCKYFRNALNTKSVNTLTQRDGPMTYVTTSLSQTRLPPLLSENTLYENIQTEMWDTNMKELDILG